MAIPTIPGQENINIGLPNETQNSDSLYAAFNKTQNNFTTLFNTASPYSNFVGGEGINANADSNTNIVTITNTGVTYINAGTGITLTGNVGNITIAANSGGGGGGGTVTSISVVGAGPDSRITAMPTTINTSGTFVLDLATTGVTAGTYTYPTLTVDDWGRINNISNGNSVGTVTSVGIIPGPGILVTGSPVTSNGEMTVVNTGVIRLNAGTGIALSDSNGNVTISTAQNLGTVTSVEVVSSTLNVSGSPIVSSGSIIIDLPGNMQIPGNIYLPENSYAPANGLILTPNGHATIYSYGSGSHGGPELDWSNSDDIGNFFDPLVYRNTLYLNDSGLYVGVNENGVIGEPQGSLSFDNYGNLITTGNITTSTGNISGGNIISTGSLVASGSENLTDGSPANLRVIASYFSTTGPSTATLAAGINGQIKTFMMAADGGDMVITVTNAGWKSSGTGTITFNDIGDSCTLQYINNKWYCIGQNGVTFG